MLPDLPRHRCRQYQGAYVFYDCKCFSCMQISVLRDDRFSNLITDMENFISHILTNLYCVPSNGNTHFKELREIVTAAIGTKFSARWGEQMVEMVSNYQSVLVLFSSSFYSLIYPISSSSSIYLRSQSPSPSSFTHFNTFTSGHNSCQEGGDETRRLYRGGC